MHATEFECRHQVFIRNVLIAAALATYLFDRDDVVWRFIRNYPANRELEHIAFSLAAALIGIGAVLCTVAAAFNHDGTDGAGGCGRNRRSRVARCFGDWVSAVGLASLVPLWGAVLLVAGESVRVIRLMWPKTGTDGLAAEVADAAPGAGGPHWGKAFRLQAAKWGIFATMIAFAITLIDRLADVLAISSIVLWALLNVRPLGRSPKATRR